MIKRERGGCGVFKQELNVNTTNGHQLLLCTLNWSMMEQAVSGQHTVTPEQNDCLSQIREMSDKYLG